MNPSKIARIILDNKIYEGTLNFYAIKKVQEELKNRNFEHKVYHIFKYLGNEKYFGKDEFNVTLTSLLLYSISSLGHKEEEVSKSFLKEEDLNIYIVKVLDFINELINKCMPKSDEEDEYEKPDWWSPKDWNFDEMEYMWYTILKRNDDFYKISPKEFFSQMDIYKKINNIKR